MKATVQYLHANRVNERHSGPLSEENSQKLGLLIALLSEKAFEAEKPILRVLELICEQSLKQKQELTLLKK